MVAQLQWLGSSVSSQFYLGECLFLNPQQKVAVWQLRGECGHSHDGETAYYRSGCGHLFQGWHRFDVLMNGFRYAGVP
jgi:hypothetical protein